jgi:hypothetical protein
MVPSLVPLHAKACRRYEFQPGLDFHGSRLDTFEKDGERWVAMRPIVEGIGLD